MTRALTSKDVMKSWELWYNSVSQLRNLKPLSTSTSRDVICRNTNQREREVVEGIPRLTEVVWAISMTKRSLPKRNSPNLSSQAAAEMCRTNSKEVAWTRLVEHIHF
jgi:hypothetical protein